MDKSIDPEFFIPLVHERAVLWDKTLEEYKNKQLKISAWREICCILMPDFDKLEEKERQQYGKQVLTKWSNLRDTWIRTNKNDKGKSGAGAKSTKSYIYKEQMSFLKKIAMPNMTHDSIRKRPTQHTTENVDTEDGVDSSPSNTKKSKSMDISDKMSQFLDARLNSKVQGDHPMLSYFKGILPSIMSFDDDEMLELQSGVLSLIQTIKNKRQSRLYTSDYNWYTQSRENIRSGYSTQNQKNMFPSPGGSGYSVLNQNALHSPGTSGYSTQQNVEPASPATSTWSRYSTSTQDSSELNFDEDF